METKTKLLDQMRHVLRLKHLSIRTEKAYVQWAKRFILFHHKRHPADMGAPEIRAFLIHLAVQGQVAASTQNVGEGLHLLAEALAVMDTTGERSYEAELHRLHGELLLRQAVPEAQAAEDCFHQAKSRELRAATS